MFRRLLLVYLSSLILIGTIIFCAVHFGTLCYSGFCENLHLKRWAFSFMISLLVTAWGLKRKSLDWSGAAFGLVVGVILTFSSYCFLACLLAFFYTSSKATHFCSEKKKKLEDNYKEGGQRNWIQVVCNGGTASEFALLYVLYGGIGETVLDFESNYVRSWLATSVLSALAGANGDTWASEIGTVMSKTEPRLITSLQKVPIGTNGGFTLVGIFFSALGGTVIGLAYLLALIIFHRSGVLFQQGLFLIVLGTLAGLLGSLVDSIIGATLQYSGLDVRSGKVVESPGIGVKHIAGRRILDNHSVNMIMSIINSIVVPTIASRLYLIFR